jgi:hypothetical protein
VWEDERLTRIPGDLATRPSQRFPTPPAASRATACAPNWCRSRWSANVPCRSCRRGRAPALLVVPRELKVVALVRHADGDVGRSRTSSRAKCGARGARDRTRAWSTCEADRSTQELASLVVHELLDHGVIHGRAHASGAGGGEVPC